MNGRHLTRNDTQLLWDRIEAGVPFDPDALALRDLLHAFIVRDGGNSLACLRLVR